jgi:hypothetical protein
VGNDDRFLVSRPLVSFAILCAFRGVGAEPGLGVTRERAAARMPAVVCGRPLAKENQLATVLETALAVAVAAVEGVGGL